MKLVTRFELAAKSTTELHALYSNIFNALVGCDEQSHERLNAQASLETIRTEPACRALGL